MPGNSPSLVMPTKGMIKDMHPSVLPENCYAHALNVNVEDFDGQGFPIPQNESSTLLNALLPAGYKACGYKRILEWGRTIIFMVNPFTGESAITELRDSNCVSHLGNTPVTSYCGCHNYDALENVPLELQTPIPCNTLRVIKSAACLGFNVNYPVKIEYDIVKNQLFLYFTDYKNVMRFVYMHLDLSDNLQINEEFHTVSGLGSCGEPIYTNILDCNKIKVQPDIKPICITYIDEIPTGGCKAGVYQFYASLATATGKAISQYTPATNEIPLFSRVITQETDYNTNKGISLKISGLEYSTIHQFYNIAVAKTINNITSYELVATLPISTTEFNYTGTDEALERLALSDVVQMFNFYKTAKGVTQANEYLFFNGLVEYEKGNWQRVANLVKLKWQTTQMPLGSYKNSRLAQRYRSYMRDEVVPFGLVIGFTNGEETSVLHIPCQVELEAGQDATITNADAINIENCADTNTNKYWQVYNTAKVTERPEQSFVDCEDTAWHRGEFAYWESSLKYPNNPLIWGDLCNTPIRHHKFPDAKISPIHDDQANIYPIGVVVDHVSIHNAITNCVNQGLITEEQRNRIAYYRIVRGNRAGNKSIIAKGLLYDVNNIVCKFKDGSSKSYFYPNYPFNELEKDELISPTYDTYTQADSTLREQYKTPFVRSNRYTFHSPDTHFNNPGIGTLLCLESLEHGTSVGQFKEVINHQKQRFATTFAYTLAAVIGYAIRQESNNKEEKTVNRKNYHTSSIYDVDAFGPKTWVSQTGGGGTGGLPVTGAPPPLGGLPGNNLTTRNWENYIHHAADPIGITPRYSEETYVWNTGTKRDFLGRSIFDPVSLNPYENKIVTGEKQKPNAFGMFIMTFLAGLAPTLETILMSLIEIDKILKMIYTIIPLKNYALQYQAVGNYNKSDFTNIVAGNRRRYITDYSYLSPAIQNITEKIGLSTNTTNILFNNWRRESSLYLKHHGNGFTAPNIVDNSRTRVGSGEAKIEPGNTIERTVSSYYAAIKQFIPDQYGMIYDVEYVETGHCPFQYVKNAPFQDNTGIYGGDTFINGFALKRKHSFFLQNGYDRPDEADWQYEFLGNVGFPNFYYNTKGPLAERISSIFDIDNFISASGFQNFIQNILGVPKNRLDGAPLLTGGGLPDPGELFYQNGYIYTWYYGIPYFYCESDVNVDLRHGLDTKENDFYPNQQDFDQWLQEKYVPIEKDNMFHYNRSYSKQNKNPKLSVDGPRFKPNDVTETNRVNEIIYSQPRNIEDSYDPWLIFYPNNRHRFDNSRGNLISIDGIENDKILARFENNIALFNAYVTIDTSSQNVAIIGSGGMFQTPPQDFLRTDLGYLGTQHTAILNTDFGHVWVDAKRGQVWNLKAGGGGLEELTRNGMRNWFKQNLPFQVLKDFPAMTQADVDNPLKGVGLCMGYDKRFNRVFITKLDYKKVNEAVQWDTVEKCFYIPANNGLSRQKISVHDERYFCNRSWTVAYNVASQFWISFYSYIPNYYIAMEDHFQTGINSYETDNNICSVWDHNLTNKSYQVIYGKLAPLEIDIIPKLDLKDAILNSVMYRLDTWRYHNEYDKVFMDDIGFNKALVYNNMQCSGMLHLNYQPENDMRVLYPYYDSNVNSMQIRVSKDLGIWSFNQFHDMVDAGHRNIPFLLHNCSNTRTYVNLKAMQFGTGFSNEMTIRGEQTVVRLINDKHSNYKMVLRWMNFDKQTS